MIGAIVGDIVGSRFEWNNHKTKDFALFTDECRFTDDSVMTLAICNAFLQCKTDFSDLSLKTTLSMRKLGRVYPDCDYGGRFNMWLHLGKPEPYNSYGNGAAMRVSACAYVACSLDEAKKLSETVTAVTHNHPEGLKGAEATTVAISLALAGNSKKHIKKHISDKYYPIDFTLDSIRDGYKFYESCQYTVPQALAAFFESVSFEDAIRNAISLGGDSDTIAAITGSIAEAFYGIPDDIRKRALSFLDEHLLGILNDFEEKYPPSSRLFRRQCREL
ncbi:MAG: ADP-ribosylglycohydrolase [Candidatus Riflebacteria bacterium]|nr:ADP-ribosylglycohydrolase [Candidatus Riflebacteria bacterium]